MNEHLLVRIFVAAALAFAVLAFVLMPIPTGAKGNSELPAVALQQPLLYHMEVALAVFYGGLLLLTPAFAGLARGQLPIEISARGARFADWTDEALDGLEETTDDLAREMSLIASDVERLKRANDDKTKPPVISD